MDWVGPWGRADLLQAAKTKIRLAPVVEEAFALLAPIPVSPFFFAHYRGTSLMGNRNPLGSCSRTLPMALRGVVFSYERCTPVSTKINLAPVVEETFALLARIPVQGYLAHEKTPSTRTLQ